MILRWRAELESWPYRTPFVIARVTLTEALNLLVEVESDGLFGRGECEPHESDVALAEQALAEARSLFAARGATLDRAAVNTLPNSPLRNALDCALWDLEAQRRRRSVAELLGIALPDRLPITGTVSLGTPESMAAEAREKQSQASVLKVKLGSADAADMQRLAAVRGACPDQPLIVDANGGWTMTRLVDYLPALEATRVDLLEQPLPPGADDGLAMLESTIPLCADESVTDTASLARLPSGYAAINIKLDKCGGLTEALRLVDALEAQGLFYMVGSNGGTSLAAAPAYLLAAGARFVDIDSPTMLAEDRVPGMRFADGHVYAPGTGLWGAPR